VAERVRTAIDDDHARRTYDAFAPHYDAFTAHHDYDAWTANLERLAVAAGLRGRRLLDVACGTGKSFLPFLDRGYDVTACDVSPRMLAIAEAKAGGRSRLECHDMRRLPVLGAFDLVTCLDDSVNYLLSDAELEAALGGIRRNLAPGGVAVLDANSLWMYRGFFASLTVLPADDLVLVWRGESSPEARPGAAVSATVEALGRRDDGTWTSEAHTHRQRHHPEPALRRAAVAAGLRVAARHGMTTDGAIHDTFGETEHSKALYVLTAAAA
jgi:SAM-dependent methyltransferase